MTSKFSGNDKWAAGAEKGNALLCFLVPYETLALGLAFYSAASRSLSAWYSADQHSQRSLFVLHLLGAQAHATKAYTQYTREHS